MGLTELEKVYLTEEINIALEKTDYSKIYKEDSEKRRDYFKEHKKEYYSDPENRAEKQAGQRRYNRERRGSEIDPDAPSTRPNKRQYSQFEINNRSRIQKVFPNVEVLFNEKPKFLYNPLTRGRFESDAMIVEYSLIIETNETKCHSQKTVQINDLRKAEIIKFHGWDLIVLTEDIENIELYLQYKWYEILNRRINDN